VADEAARIEAIARGDTASKWLPAALRAAGVLKEGERCEHHHRHGRRPGAAGAGPAQGYDIVYAGKTPTEKTWWPCAAGMTRGHHRALRQGGRAVMDAAPSLKVISKHGSGTDTIDKARPARGIEVVAAVGANAAAVAEQALALLLACAKSVVQLDARMHAGHWDKATHKSLELAGRTVGLVGLGAIGLRFAKMADALGMRVIGFDPFAKNLPDYVQA
jgi:D-3-phosphoglycerate dehydrogenase